MTYHDIDNGFVLSKLSRSLYTSQFKLQVASICNWKCYKIPFCRPGHKYWVHTYYYHTEMVFVQK